MGNNKMDLAEIGFGGGNWIGMAHDKGKWRASVNAAIKFWVL
jgi:hypothetical protein